MCQKLLEKSQISKKFHFIFFQKFYKCSLKLYSRKSPEKSHFIFFSPNFFWVWYLSTDLSHIRYLNGISFHFALELFFFTQVLYLKK